MSRYVPPALRKQAQSSDAPSTVAPKSPATSPSTPFYTLNELRNYYFPSNIDDDASSTSQTSKTLHDSAATPGKLSHVLLFRNANPRWESDGIIYTKSALELLPEELAEATVPNKTATPTIYQSRDIDQHNANPPVQMSATSTITTPPATQATLKVDSAPSTTTIKPSQSQPIAAYTQISGSSQTPSFFEFAGYYNITNLQFLQPHTPELIRILEQKWTFTNLKSGKSHHIARSKESWGKSLDFTWAVIKLAEDEETLKKAGPPKIEKLESEESPVEKKSVNEMLREMRLGAKGRDGSWVQTQTPAADDDTPTPQQEIRQAPTRQPRAPTEGAGTFGSKTNKSSTP